VQAILVVENQIPHDLDRSRIAGRLFTHLAESL
jgi:hypothetical protein